MTNRVVGTEVLLATESCYIVKPIHQVWWQGKEFFHNSYFCNGLQDLKTHFLAAAVGHEGGSCENQYQNAVGQIGDGLSGVNRLGEEAENHLVLTRLYVEGTQDIVYPTQLSWLAIDGGSPTWVINLREYHYATLTRINIVGKLVGLVGLDGNLAQCVLSNTIAKLSLEFLLIYSLVAQIDFTLLKTRHVAILVMAYLTNKPRILKA